MGRGAESPARLRLRRRPLAAVTATAWPVTPERSCGRPERTGPRANRTKPRGECGVLRTRVVARGLTLTCRNGRRFVPLPRAVRLEDRSPPLPGPVVPHRLAADEAAALPSVRPVHLFGHHREHTVYVSTVERVVQLSNTPGDSSRLVSSCGNAVEASSERWAVTEVVLDEPSHLVRPLVRQAVSAAGKRSCDLAPFPGDPRR